MVDHEEAVEDRHLEDVDLAIRWFEAGKFEV